MVTCSLLATWLPVVYYRLVLFVINLGMYGLVLQALPLSCILIIIIIIINVGGNALHMNSLRHIYFTINT